MPNPVPTGLVGEYACVDANGTTLPDTSGAGNPGTLGLYGGYNPTVTTRGLQFSGQQLADLPAAIASPQTRTYMIFLDVPQAATRGTTTADLATMTFAESNSFNTSYGISSTDRRIGRYRPGAVGYADPIYADLLPPTVDGAALLGVTFAEDCAAGTGSLYLNGEAVSDLYTYAMTWPNNTGDTYLRIGFSNVVQGQAYNGTVAYILAWNRVLSAAEVASADTYVRGILSARSGVTLGDVSRPHGTRPLFVVLGDSISRGYGGGTGGAGWVDQTMRVMARDFLPINLSVGGLGMTGPTGGLAREGSLQTLLQGGYGVDGQDVVALFLGTNDGWTAGAVTDTETVVADCLAWGARAVLICTGLSRDNEGASARTAFNTSLRGLCDGKQTILCDFGSNLLLGQNGDYSDRTYFYDNAHLQALGYTVLASQAGALLNAISPTYAVLGTAPTLLRSLVSASGVPSATRPVLSIG